MLGLVCLTAPIFLVQLSFSTISMSLILRESIHVLACDSTRRRPRKIEAGTSHEHHIQVACRRVFLYFFVLSLGETIRRD